MAVLVAQAPQAEPRTWALASLPSLDIEVTEPRAKSAPVRCRTNLTGLVNIGESDLGVGCYVQFETCPTCTAPFIADTKPARLNSINRLNSWIWHLMTIWGKAPGWITHTGVSGLCSRGQGRWPFISFHWLRMAPKIANMIFRQPCFHHSTLKSKWIIEFSLNNFYVFSTSFSNWQIWRIQLLSPGSFCIFRNVSCAFLTRPHSRLANVSDRNHNGSVLWKRQMDLRLGVNMRRNTFTPGEGL